MERRLQDVLSMTDKIFTSSNPIKGQCESQVFLDKNHVQTLTLFRSYVLTNDLEQLFCFVGEAQDTTKLTIMNMKKSILVSFVTLMALTISSCGSSNKVPQASKAEQENPYGTEVFKTDAEKYAEEAPGKRAVGKGVSFSESTARELAEMDARAQMSRAIDAAIVSASKRSNVDINQYAGGNNEGKTATDGGLQSNTLDKSISSNIVANANVVKTNKFYGKDRKYTIFVCLEYNGSVADIAQKAAQLVKQRVSDKDREKIQAEHEKFQKEIEKDLEGK